VVLVHAYAICREKKQFFIPEGFAHGFSVLSNEVEFCYKVNDFWHSRDEDGTALNLSDKDQKWLGLKGIFKILTEKNIMITPRDIENKSMSPEKRKSAKNDYFAFYIGRPLSYIVTIPFLYTNISPNTVSLISIIPIIVGFVLMCIGSTNAVLIVGWLMFFLWNLLDGVDGNIARYKKQFSTMGSVYDAMSGYIAMVLSFFGWGVAAAHNPGLFQSIVQLPPDFYIILGALSGIFVIFPRFIMHKAITTLGDQGSMKTVKDKSGYGFVKLVALNLTSIAGFVQVLMLIAVVFNIMDLFTIGYFVLNFMVMVVSIKSIFNVK
jgi:phosphatidylglycerophosphate synthase